MTPEDWSFEFLFWVGILLMILVGVLLLTIPSDPGVCP